MAPLSLFFMFAYPWSVYMSGHGRGNFSKLEQGNMPEGSYQGGPFGIHAWLAMLNPSDSIKAILFIFKQDNRNASTTSVNMTGYQSNDPLVSHPYNPQPYSTTN
jgi:hypothetical protein